MTTERTLVTAEEFFWLPDGKPAELVGGKVVRMPPAGGQHGAVAATLTLRVGNFVERRRTGKIFAAETGFIIRRNPDTVRAPDVAYIAQERLPVQLPPGFMDLVPDLVAEVVSPSDSASEVQAKVEDWLSVGVQLVWVVHPNARSVTVYQSREHVRVLKETDTLTGATVLPGFSCRVAELF